jgi:hypothetical protein
MAKSKGKAKGKATVQSSLAIPAYPHLKKPLDHLGKQIAVPGSAWGGRVAPDELQKLYKCTVQDFTLAHSCSGELRAWQARMHPHQASSRLSNIASASKLENACMCTVQMHFLVQTTRAQRS